jgi:hypothetical protein
MHYLFAVQVIQPIEDMTSEIPNNRFCHGSIMLAYILVYGTWMNILKVYVEPIFCLDNQKIATIQLVDR